MYYIPGKINPADILTKTPGFQEYWPQLRPILFWRGDTHEVLPTKGSDSGNDSPMSVQRMLSVAQRSVTLDYSCGSQFFHD
mmetsp:Transcript_16013/g.36783  ORF Transcript_16013/g.36783 Transcript_16013/m.36783 type:complete len:81 (-) Transcript_16013:22-264(-)